LRVLQQQEVAAADGVLYLDPDITVAAPWNRITEWMECGVMLCEDVNSPVSRNHPRRIAWRKFFAQRGFSLGFREAAYVNGGCVGIHRENVAFIEVWQSLQVAMSEEIGGLGNSKLGGGTSSRMRDPHYHFNASDQDALNAAVEA